MKQEKNIIIPGKHGKPVVADLFYDSQKKDQPIVIFAHGFKGFKDWGPYDIIAKEFVDAGFCFIKFNFSHNGTTLDAPDAFADLEAFGQNNFTKELDDFDVIINYIQNDKRSGDLFDSNAVYLAGHSRGGGVAILKAAEDKRVKKLSSWASPIEFSKYITPGQVEIWKQMGVIYVENSRTKQQMPLYYQLAEDVLNNKQRLDIKNAVQHLSIPFLIVHGTKDETVAYTDALVMHSWNTNATLLPIINANHSFGAEHPYRKNELTTDYLTVVHETIRFFKR